LRNKCYVTLHIAREEPAGSFNYERLPSISAPNVPKIVEIGYDFEAEKFTAYLLDQYVKSGKIEQLGREIGLHHQHLTLLLMPEHRGQV
jgi:hypothetical protein